MQPHVIIGEGTVQPGDLSQLHPVTPIAQIDRFTVVCALRNARMVALEDAKTQAAAGQARTAEAFQKMATDFEVALDALGEDY